MSFARQSPSKQGKEAIEYCRDGKFDALYNKKGKVEEDSCVLMGEMNMVPNEVIPYEEQMASVWDHTGNPRHKNEVRRLIFSFAPDELDCRRLPNGEFVNPDSPYKALEITKAYCEKTFPDRQVAFFVQADGKRSRVKTKDGMVHPVIHVHAIVNDWSLVDGKGVPTHQTDAKWLAHSFSDFVKEYTFENGDQFHVTKNQDKNLASLDAGYKPNRFHEKRVKESWFEKQRTDGDLEKINEDGLYNSYKDYLVDVIQGAKEQALSEDDFIHYLSENGVEVEHKSSKKKGDFIKYSIRDEFIYRKDADNSKAVVMAPKTNNASIGDEKLSKWADDDMGYSGIQAAIARNVANAPVPEPVKAEPVQPVEVIPVSVPVTEPVAEVETEPVIKHHKAEPEEPKQKTAEELEQERDNRLRERFTTLAGIDIFIDHDTWQTKDNFEELLEERDARWKQFKEWYPDDYEERLANGDISEPIPETEPVQADITPVNGDIPVSEPVKSHTEDVSEFKKHKQDAVQKAEASNKPDKTLIRKQSEDEQKINRILADAEELDRKMAKKQAEDSTDEWGRRKK